MIEVEAEVEIEGGTPPSGLVDAVTQAVNDVLDALGLGGAGITTEVEVDGNKTEVEAKAEVDIGGGTPPDLGAATTAVEGARDDLVDALGIAGDPGLETDTEVEVEGTTTTEVEAKAEIGG